MNELLLHLESMAIMRIREVFRNSEKVALFVSESLSSEVLRHLVQQALFPFEKDYCFVHIAENDDFSKLSIFFDRIRQEEKQELVVKSYPEMLAKDPHFQNVPRDTVLNFALKDVIQSHGFEVMITGVLWERSHPWLDHGVVFRENCVQRVEPLGNWTRRDLENYACASIKGYEKPLVRVS